ncbi:mechanosensitive ion channel family protein, partial [Halobium palmae]
VGVLPLLGRLVVTAGLLVGVVVGTDVLEAQLSTYAERSDRFNEHQQGIAFRVLQLVLLIAVGMGVLTVWSFDVGGLLVGAGFLGIVVGMAARQTLGSLIAGFVLMFSQPFKLGDWVVVGGHEGVVTDVTIVNTRLWSFDGETVVLPNDVVSKSTIENRTERGRLRLSVPVGVDYDTDLDRADEVITAAIDEVDGVLDVPKPQVVPQSFDDSAITLEVRVWIDNPSGRKRWRTRAAVIRALKRAFDREGIDVPFPQRVL